MMSVYSQFSEKGPYIYTETEMKEDIAFSVTEVSYRLNRIYTFDVDSTASECRICQPDDMLSIINPWYLQVVGQAGGENALAWSNLPNYVIEFLKRLGFVYTDEDIVMYNSNISTLGIHSYLSPPPRQQPSWDSFSFGAWLGNHTNTSYGSVIVGERKDQPFTASENMCSSSYVEIKTVSVAECRVYFLLRKCPDNNMSSSVRDILQRTFCPPGEDGCLNVTRSSDDRHFLAYKNAIFDFLTFLSGVVLNNVISSWDLSLVANRNRQSELALGYDVMGDSVIGSVRVPAATAAKMEGPAAGRSSTVESFDVP
ncbi:hypothetical protein Btru_017897 [Bulinus truncatus]|nr:hypothetical protein Btru_017897 [Bulinus truncatus]